MSTTPREFTFLLGSGVSCAAKLSNVQTLSCKVSAATTGAEAKLLAIIKDLCGATHGDGNHSYEDWFFVADEIVQHESGDLENPALFPFMERLRCSLELNNADVRVTAEGLCSAIGETIRRELASTKADKRNAFAELEAAIKKRPTGRFRFFTLNHDLLLETWLKDHDIAPYTCVETHPESAAFDRVSFSREVFNAAAVSVIKLHGSINWRRFRPKRNRKSNDPFRGEFLGVRHREDLEFEQMDDDPRALIGTWNKIVQYSSPIFMPMFAQFRECLRGTDRLVVCGYGFGDKGINSLLIDWMYSKAEPRLIVIDPHPFDPSRCRGAVWDKIDAWREDGRLEIIPRRVGTDDMTWMEIAQLADAR